jgi:hypothetical protein
VKHKKPAFKGVGKGCPTLHSKKWRERKREKERIALKI